jgi:hypothetical protein
VAEFHIYIISCQLFPESVISSHFYDSLNIIRNLSRSSEKKPKKIEKKLPQWIYKVLEIEN